MSVSYSAACKCVTRVYRSGAGVVLDISRRVDGTANITRGGEFQHEAIVPLAQVQPELDKAHANLEAARTRYGDLIKSR